MKGRLLKKEKIYEMKKQCKYFKAAKEMRYIERKKYKDGGIFLVEKKIHEIQLGNIFKVLKDKNICQPRILYLGKIFCKKQR